MVNWVSIKRSKPKLGQKCLCYIRAKRYDGSIYEDIRALYYLRDYNDTRKRAFFERHYIPLPHDL